MDVWAVPRPQAHEVEREWDQLADRRRQEILGGLDSSFSDTLLPAVKDEVRMARSRSKSIALLDVGCGTGELTAQLHPLVDSLIAIDPSSRSIELARELAPHVPFTTTDLSSFANAHSRQFDLAVANMVLMNVVQLESFLRDLVEVLKPRGGLIATVTHPWTWPRYWAYEQAPWFDYESELYVQARWKVSKVAVAAPQISTHIHRPLSRYVEALVDVGFTITGIRELGRTTVTRGGHNVIHPFPRFLLLVAQLR